MLRDSIERAITNACGAAVDACICYTEDVEGINFDWCEKLVDEALTIVDFERTQFVAAIGNVCSVPEVNDEVADILDWFDRSRDAVCKWWDVACVHDENLFYSDPANW